jgi:hypothetical protein
VTSCVGETAAVCIYLTAPAQMGVAGDAPALGIDRETRRAPQGLAAGGTVEAARPTRRAGGVGQRAAASTTAAAGVRVGVQARRVPEVLVDL